MAEEQESVEKGVVPTPFVELANLNLYRPWGYTREEFLPQLQGKRASAVYLEMSDNDPIVGTTLFAIEMMLRRVNWEVEPFSSDQKHMDEADFVATCMNDMSHSWADLISDILTMLPYGFSYIECVYKKRQGYKNTNATQKSRYDDGKIGWRKFVLIPAVTISQFDFDAHGGIQSARQQQGNGFVDIPIEKALLFRTTKRYPRGRSVLRNAYLPWYYKKRIEEIEGIGVERDLAGLPVMYLDPDLLADSTRRSEYETIIRNIRRDEQEGVLLPAVFDETGKNPLVRLELLSSSGNRQFDTDTIISRLARQITMTVLQDVVMMGHEKVGTASLASEKRDLSDTALGAWLEDIASILNLYALPRLLELNGMNLEEPPKLIPGDLRQENVLNFTEAIKNMAQAGFLLAGDPDIENFVRRRLGLPLGDEEDFKPDLPSLFDEWGQPYNPDQTTGKRPNGQQFPGEAQVPGQAPPGTHPPAPGGTPPTLPPGKAKPPPFGGTKPQGQFRKPVSKPPR